MLYFHVFYVKEKIEFAILKLPLHLKIFCRSNNLPIRTSKNPHIYTSIRPRSAITSAIFPKNAILGSLVAPST